MWKRPWIAYGAVFLGVCGHASSEFMAVLSGVFGPEVSVWRFLLGGSGLVLWALLTPAARDLLTPLREHGLRLMGLSFFGVSIAYLAFHWALDFASVIQVATVTTTIPIFVGLANLVINRVRITAVKWVTGMAAILGVALLVTDGALADLAGGGVGSLPGVGLALLCAALGSGYAVLVRPLIQEYGALRITAISMFLGAIGLWLVVGGIWGIWVNPLAIFDRSPLESWSLLTLAFWNTTLTQWLWFGGLAAVPDITRGSYLFFLKPVIAAALAIAILSQPITQLEATAIVVICGAVLAEVLWSYVSPADQQTIPGGKVK
ncbi:MAG: DMT family transporter [Arenicellales bacterium]|nr:DMT family transporter [Arenicellales bacterium]